ncbi:hypothetical protein N7474_001435 [Penicillium riverlandense]|uniref:uncharacterized protein n=1 Tax=Penicillium riverlandense TaxID=1903569 RepID=UPI002547BA70|nr:uncharacterized protein N7474_001435 [Penicillium riverlandense]KAJ5833124.1 hypothetical protein N7474_001435 [Penicillium riverlandense]
MGDHDMSMDPAANAPDAAFVNKGKGKAQDPTHEMSMDEEESSDESENEIGDNDDEEDDADNLEPISASNIITGGRRTRGKAIDFAEAAEKSKNEGDEMDDDDDDDDYEAADNNNQDHDDDDQMRD